MFLKLKHYFGILCMGFAFSAWSDNALTLTDLGAQIKQNENEILTQIVGEASDVIIGYFDIKSPKIHKKAGKNTYFVRKMLGKTENGDWVLQDFYFDGELNAKPLTSIYILPKKIKPQQKQIIGKIQAGTLVWYRENGLPAKIMQTSELGENKIYLFNIDGIINAIFDDKNNIKMFHENGKIKSNILITKGKSIMQSWYKNGQMRFNMDMEKDKKGGIHFQQHSQMWYENGQLYYQNQDNQIQFWYENGQAALTMTGNDIQIWDENGKPISENKPQILQEKMNVVHAEMQNINRQMTDILK